MRPIFKKILPFAIMGGICFSLSMLRVYITHSYTFLFLNWNLFLAFVPLFIGIHLCASKKPSKTRFMLWSLAWLVFFPNAPYILTDFIHLKLDLSAPLWFDVALLSCFSWVGLIYGFYGLISMEKYWRHYIKSSYLPIIRVLILFLSGFGIYLGRYLRWNTWDVVYQPMNLLTDISDRLIHPFSHPKTWGVTLVFGLLLNLMAFSLKLMQRTSR